MSAIATFEYGGYGNPHCVYSPDDASLGGNIDHGDPLTHAPLVWDYLVQRFAIRSVLDVGCGQGHTAAYFHRVHNCIVLATDGLDNNPERTVYPVIIHDLRKGALVARVDLVYCVETVEHISAEFVDHVVTTLANGRVIAMTHAPPGQAGHHHVNCQPPEYWIELLRLRGYALAIEDTKRIRALGERDGSLWLQRSGLLFIRN